MNTIKGEKFEELHNGYNIFYTHIDNVYDFFNKKNENPFVLITHNSDGAISKNSNNSKDILFDKLKIPKNLIKWYSQNVDVIFEKLESIPIGLENKKWFPEIRKEEKILNHTRKDKKNLLYINHNISTNPKERQSPYIIFSEKPWVTLVNGGNGHMFDDYLENIVTHNFVLCPEGNGIDTHRLWETLYVGSIPIVKNCINTSFYKDLPICFVDDWEEINENFLHAEYDRINSKNWNLEKLDFDFWKNKINTTI